MQPRPLLAPVLLGACLASAGCAVARPSLEVSGIREVGRSGDVAQVKVMIDLANDGTDEVQLVEYEYVVALADGSRYAGRWAALRALPPTQRIAAEVPAVLPCSSIDAGGTWSVQGVMRYRDPQSVARILYEAGFLRTEVEFAAEGAAIARPGSSS